MASSDFGAKLLSKFLRIVKSYSRVACDQVRQQWQIHGDEPSTSGESKIVFTMENAQSVITAHVYAWGQKAWILEFGRGSLMENDPELNPFFEAYKNDPNTNQEREYYGWAIVGRPKGKYKDLDGNIRESRGTMQGVNLEQPKIWFNDFQRFYYIPREPKYIIRNILIGENNDGLIFQMNIEFQAAIREVYSEIINRFTRELKLL